MPSPPPNRLRIGTRGSALALWQSRWVSGAIGELHPDLDVELHVIKTKGDHIQDVPLSRVGGKGLFVKEIEEALLDGRVDIAVHSMKDMPSEIPRGLCIGAVPSREDSHDVLISRKSADLRSLPERPRIGTSSLRRSAQIRAVRPDAVIVPLRGNLDTRLRKLETESLDAIVLAAAGVRRLGFESRITEHLDTGMMVPAAGQGALCIEIRADDTRTFECIASLDDPTSHAAVRAERAFLHRLQGDCQTPIAALGEIRMDDLHLTGLVADLAGATIFRESVSGSPSVPEALGIRLAEILLARGAAAVLAPLQEKER